MWIEYDSGLATMQWENTETKEIIQSYGNDKRYPEFKKKLEIGEILPVKWEETEEFKLGKEKQEKDLQEFLARINNENN